MAGVNLNTAPVLSANARSPLSLGQLSASMRQQDDPTWSLNAEALDKVQAGFNFIQRVLKRQSQGNFPQIQVTAPDGTVIGWIGINSPYFGAWFKQLYVGATGPATAPLFADVNGNVIIGKNGAVSVRDLANSEKGYLGVKIESPKTILGITNATPPVVNVAAHGYTTGDTVTNAGTGVATYNGNQIITVTDANHFSLNGVVAAGVSAIGTATRYFAGIWAQTAAFSGTGFGDAKIKCQADGSVIITNATITLDTGGVTTTIGNLPAGSEGIAGINIKNDTAPSQDVNVTDKGFFVRASNQTTDVAVLQAAADRGSLLLGVAGDLTKSVTLLAGQGRGVFSNGSNQTNVFPNSTTITDGVTTTTLDASTVNTTTYKAGGTSGVASGVVTYVKTVDFGGSTVTTGTITFKGGIVIGFT